MVTVAAKWDPAACRSAALLTPTKWPHTRTVQVKMDLELAALPGQTCTISPELHFLVRCAHPAPPQRAAAAKCPCARGELRVLPAVVDPRTLLAQAVLEPDLEAGRDGRRGSPAQVYTKEKVGLKAQRAKNWAEEEFMKLSPGTRKLIKGAVVVTKLAVKAAAHAL